MSDTDAFYRLMHEVMLDVWGENFHQGYWESAEDKSSIQDATERLTDLLIEKTGTAGGRLLDIGCGVGLPAFKLAKQAPVEIVGISNNQGQIDDANSRAAAQGLADRVSFQYADAAELPFPDDSFDVVWIFEALMHMDRLHVLRECLRVLRPGGRIVVTDQLQLGEMTPENARLVQEMLDGMHAKPLLYADAYQALVRESGLELVEFHDISKHTQLTGHRVIETVERRQEELLERHGEGVLPVLELFKNPAGLVPELGYLLFVARKPEKE
ncbi:methyltransferase domain-containing protein [Actinokineospora sp. NPDC004072]